MIIVLCPVLNVHRQGDKFMKGIFLSIHRNESYKKLQTHCSTIKDGSIKYIQIEMQESWSTDESLHSNR